MLARATFLHLLRFSRIIRNGHKIKRLDNLLDVLVCNITGYLYSLFVF